MILTYENRNTEIALERKKSIHVPPHLHEAIEMVYVTEGSVELGVGQELYHLEKGDFGIVFPNVIHHYEVSICLQNPHFLRPIWRNCKTIVLKYR